MKIVIFLLKSRLDDHYFFFQSKAEEFLSRKAKSSQILELFSHVLLNK